MSERQKKTDEMMQIARQIRGLEARKRIVYGKDRADAVARIRSLTDRLNALKNEIVMAGDAVRQRRAAV